MAEDDRSTQEVRSADLGAEFRVCPECGYEDGFHNMFSRTGEPGVLKWCFICPNCHSRWDVGLTVPAP
jgi:hypothetical protein